MAAIALASRFFFTTGRSPRRSDPPPVGNRRSAARLYPRSRRSITSRKLFDALEIRSIRVPLDAPDECLNISI